MKRDERPEELDHAQLRLCREYMLRQALEVAGEAGASYIAELHREDGPHKGRLRQRRVEFEEAIAAVAEAGREVVNYREEHFRACRSIIASIGGKLPD